METLGRCTPRLIGCEQRASTARAAVAGGLLAGDHPLGKKTAAYKCALLETAGEERPGVPLSELARPSVRSLCARLEQVDRQTLNPDQEVHATHLTERLARIISGTATLLPTPGVRRSVRRRSAS